MPFLNSPNKVLAKQKLYQDRFNHHVPTHLIPSGGHVYYYTYLTFWTVGILGTGYTAFELIRGKQTTAD